MATKLATPASLSVTGNILEFDAVENAKSYSIYAGSALVGEYTPVPQLITFKLDGMTCQAVKGMTLKEWLNSDYNTSKYYYDEDYSGLVITTSGGQAVRNSSRNDIDVTTDAIQDGESYQTYGTGVPT